MSLADNARQLHSNLSPRARTIIVFGVIFGVIVLFRIVHSHGPAPAAARLPDAAAGDPVQPQSEWEPRQTITWPMGLSRDPFVGQAVVLDDSDNIQREIKRRLHLGGILYSSSPQALINGVPCKIGDLVEGFKIESIDRQKVVLEKDGVRVELEL